jgi:hypothetical protein
LPFASRASEVPDIWKRGLTGGCTPSRSQRCTESSTAFTA